MSRLVPLVGIALAAAAAVSFAANVTIARIAYDGGSNPLSYLSLRSAMALLVVFALLRATRTPLRLPRRQRLSALALGFLMALYSWGILSAIQFIPVALATLIFYTYPLLTVAYLWLTRHERFTAGGLAAVVAAFVGLAIALDIKNAVPDLRGVGLAALAAAGLTTVMIINSRIVGRGDSRPVTLHMLTTSTIAYVIVTLAFDHAALPGTIAGLWAFFGGPLFYAFAIIAIFIAMSKLGPFRTALTMNLEPVSAAILGFVLLGQSLNALQVFGIALVIAAVVFVQLSRAHEIAPAKGETP